MNFTYVLVLIFSAILFSSKAQDHPVFSGADLSMRAVDPPTGTITTAAPFGIYIVPQLLITLRDSVEITGIRYRMLETENDTVICDVSRLLTDPPISDAQGHLLFHYANRQVTISAGQVVGMKPYRYEITATGTNLQVLQPFLKTE